MTKPFCKRCLLSESGKIDIKKEVERLIGEFPAWKKTSEKEYEDRLSVCGKCPHLNAGTCVKCGCYVEYRAAEKDKSCPEEKWQT